MSPFHGFMQDVLEQVTAGLDLSYEDTVVGWDVGPTLIDLCVTPPAQRGPYVKTDAGWVPLGREGGSE